MGLSITEILAEANIYVNANSDNDLDILSAANRQLIIKDAIKKYNRIRPREVLQVYTGTTDAWYDVPDLYEDEFSTISYIEYPIENTPPSIIDSKYYQVMRMSDGLKLRFSAYNPTLSESFWVVYTTRYTVDSNGDTNIPDAHLDALAYLSASLIASSFASYYATKANNSLPEVEIVQYNTRTQEYQSIAEKYMDKYDDEIDQQETGYYGDMQYVMDEFVDRKKE